MSFEGYLGSASRILTGSLIVKESIDRALLLVVLGERSLSS